MSQKYKIVADENIPLISEFFKDLAEVVLLPGRKITKENLLNADALLIRSITPVNAELLSGTNVNFVGSATTGTDHVDLQWLKKNHITFVDAKGCNANAVAEYVICCIALLMQKNLLPQKNLSAGIVGVGQIGSLVANKLKKLGVRVFLNDPPRAATETDFISTPLEEMQNVDLLLLHTPLTVDGKYPTYHLIDESILQKLKTGCILLNAGRGEVIDSQSYKSYVTKITGCFDVWENEPRIDLEVLKKATIATPHIAGYTVEAKLQGAKRICIALQSKLKQQPTEMPEIPKHELDLATSALSWHDVVLRIYNPENDTEKLLEILKIISVEERANYFDQLRKHYPKRHEFNSIELKNYDGINNFDREILEGLGFGIK